VTIRLAVALGLVAAAGCTRSISVTLPPRESLHLTVYSEGRVVETCKVPPGDDRYKRLDAWLKVHSDGWSVAIADYVPTILVSGNRFRLNFMQSGAAILGFDNHQYSHPVQASEYAYLTCHGGT
jgi:hypothetical protein